MRLICRKDGHVANSQFDLSLLKPVDEKEADFKSKLKPVDEGEPEQQDEGAYLDSMPEPEGFFHKLPRNMLIGLAKLGHSTLNKPHDYMARVEQSLQDFGNAKGMPKLKYDIEVKNPLKLSEYIPKQQEYNFPEMLGQKGEGTMMDNIIQGGIDWIPELAMGGGLLRAGLRRFPMTQGMASRQLREAEKLINQRRIKNIDVDQKSIDAARAFLPRTNATNEMLAGVEGGKYKPSFALQSQIGQHARDLKKSPLASERLRAPEARELKQDLLEQIENSLRNNGHHDAADLVKGGINDYRKYMAFKNDVVPLLAKIGVPTSMIGLSLFGYKKLKNSLTD